MELRWLVGEAKLQPSLTFGVTLIQHCFCSSDLKNSPLRDARVLWVMFYDLESLSLPLRFPLLL